MNAEPNTIWDVLSRVTPADLPVIILLCIFFVAALIVAIAVTVSNTAIRIHKSRLEAALKRELVDRGFSAEEITRIVESTSTPQNARRKLGGSMRVKEASHVDI